MTTATNGVRALGGPLPLPGIDCVQGSCARSIYDELVSLGGFSPPPEVEIVGQDPILDTPFRIGEVAGAVLAAQGAALSRIWEHRTGRRQHVRINVAAAATSLSGVALIRQGGYPVGLPEASYPTIGFYPTLDRRFFFLHGGFPRLRDGLLSLLRCANDERSVAAAVARWNAFDLEEAIAQQQLCGVVTRTAAEWHAHPQGATLALLPVVEIEKIGDSAPEPFGPGSRPLEGLRVLDLTHVIAGPTSARLLAEHGADVLHIASPHHPRIPSFVMDTGHGKLSALLDLKLTEDRRRLRTLASEADVFSQSYRPGKLGTLGFSPEAVAAARPGIIYVSANCYGSVGPWQYRPGWEQLAQAVTGMAMVEGSVDSPRLSPCLPNDYTTGYLAAFGVLAALLRRAQEGGSYHVKVSLCQTAMWLQRHGTVSQSELPPAPLSQSLMDKYMIESETPYGPLRAFGPVLELSETPPRWARPAVPVGAHEAAWPPRPADAENN